MPSFRDLLLVNFVQLLFSHKSIGIQPNVCNFNVQVKQALDNEGFHRNLTYETVFSSEHVGEPWLYKDCILGLDQRLPPGVYANPNELADLNRALKLKAIPKSRLSVELPAQDSSWSSVYVVGKVVTDIVYLWLPVHARYHGAVSGGGTAMNKIPPPKLYIRCPDGRLDVCARATAASVTFLCHGKKECTWKEIPYSVTTATLPWPVPVGNTDHYHLVAAATVGALVGGSVYLLDVIHRHKVASRGAKRN